MFDVEVIYGKMYLPIIHQVRTTFYNFTKFILQSLTVIAAIATENCSTHEKPVHQLYIASNNVSVIRRATAMNMSVYMSGEQGSTTTPGIKHHV